MSLTFLSVARIPLRPRDLFGVSKRMAGFPNRMKVFALVQTIDASFFPNPR
jgi:hypothetical protein